MRILRRVVDRTLVVTEAPSEPILSIAAAKALNETEDNYRSAFNCLVEKLVLCRLILDRGGQGELFSRLLLTVARDKATCSGGSSFVDEAKTKVKIITLDKFLGALLGTAEGTPGADMPPGLLASAGKKWINFTHFIHLDESVGAVTEDFLHTAWDRGAAIQCCHNQPVIEFIIPTYEGDLDQPFDHSKLGMFAGQVELQAQAADGQLVNRLATPCIQGEGVGDPWKQVDDIVMFLDLGTSTKFNDGLTYQYKHATPSHPPPPRRGNIWDGYIEDEPTRWYINVRGHSEAQYPVMGSFGTGFEQIFQASLPVTIPEFAKFSQHMTSEMRPLSQL